MTKARLIRGIRWILTAALLTEIALHAHWSVALSFFLTFLALEALTPALFRTALAIENLKALLKMNGLVK